VLLSQLTDHSTARPRPAVDRLLSGNKVGRIECAAFNSSI
jgi:hypothetical protein